ncbi:MAG TPA: KamA family radical SAM protein, partial [Methanomassiliicoccales archaeon]|nr:KamA family radical SAM protein [Methanomassiliicoccales archaeon]
YLDDMAHKCIGRVLTYPNGLDASVVRRRERQRRVVLEVLGGEPRDWNDHNWHLENTLTDLDSISKIVELTPEEEESISLASWLGVPFGITPFYISLMDPGVDMEMDHALRAQVIPRLQCLKATSEQFGRGGMEVLDFMREGYSSPTKMVTRRYPMIAIFKPYNSCAQFCAYCQRNWEIGKPADCKKDQDYEDAFRWFEEHPTVSEVLITGGDPLVLGDSTLSRILSRFAGMRHIKHLRIGSRLPVVLPMRFTELLLSLLEQVIRPPDLDISIVTHFESAYEISPDAFQAVQSLRRRGIMVYNQQVFTFENCRRFETVALRLGLKRIGIDPYYTFNTKGKEETEHFRVPISRILQERMEEARLIPGLSRTDETVFNIPGQGKNPLCAGQHHELIMIAPSGERVYEFHPWEKNLALASTYVYRDVPIGAFLRRLEERGESADDYASIWYYF